ncbi:uncharacterized protein LOC116160452 [Photinus pyralis]|uniref:uncharacterized protein LOC116160444 n=2 Tax=Photinus pyralis TaxID=7054 RepID=UPI0012670652|nr:uncharacterized protein LOC116160444 [Photinus pyralis]XP_031329504.1 uncharacterized protein LOC116160452 [Photinus pyralis]
MLLYYSRKYAVYNETVYESGTRRTFCYLWGETDGNRGCDEICTIINKYLQDVDQRVFVKFVVLYCDSCSGQNRNRAMLSMLHQFLKSSKNVHHIKIVFLLPGHTYMPVDSVHATIERFINKRTVWAPSEWHTLIANARVNHTPFEVINMKHTDFMSWKEAAKNVLPNKINKTKEGEKILLSQLRIASFKKGEDVIKIQYSFLDCDGQQTVELRQPRKSKRSASSLLEMPKIGNLYPSPLPISALKLKNLMDLCAKRVIPERYHKEYENFKGTIEVEDTLAETDEEDEKVEED